MAKVKHAGVVNGRAKEFLNLFNQLTYSRNAWQVWDDLMTVIASSISNSVDRQKEHFEKREKQYETAIKNLGGVDIPAKIFATITMALEENPNQDFLGSLYMNLNLGNHWKGQFFTPYSISELMAKMQITEESKAEIEKRGYLSVADMCVGGGAMLIAAATAFRDLGINYQTSVVFAGQDVDPVVARMAYIQISLLGCPGYVTVGDSLCNPQTGHVLFPLEKEGQDLWITPMFFRREWEMRRTGMIMQNLFSGLGTTQKKPEEKERHFIFFNFNEQEEMKHG